MSDTWISFNGNALSLNGYGLVVSGQNPYNPLNLPAYTVRFQFDDSSYDPTQVSGWKAGSAWTRVSTSPNIWDYYTGNTNRAYESAFSGKFIDVGNTVHILGAYLPLTTNTSSTNGNHFLTGCTALASIATVDFSGFKSFNDSFSQCSILSSIGTIHAPSITSMTYAFAYCPLITSAPDIKYTASNLTSIGGIFNACSSLQNFPYAYETSYVTSFESAFHDCTSLQTAPTLDTSNGVRFGGMFLGCSNLSTMYTYDLSKATDVQGMLQRCVSLRSIPTFNTRLVQNFNGMLYGCENLLEIPLFSTTNAVDMATMCRDCYSVDTGALALYQQASSQAYPPSIYTQCFTNCGIHSITGAQELAAIPTSWGGTMA